MSNPKKYAWHKIADVESELFFEERSLNEITVDGKKICIAKHGNQMHGCAAKCPHAGGTMADGYVDALGNIVCPLHRYKFNLQNGRNITGEGYFLKTYPVEVRENGIYVGIEEKTGFWNW